MNDVRDPDSILTAWLEEGPTQLPEPTRRAIAVGTRSTTQRQGGLTALRRFFIMGSFARTGLAVIAIVVALGGALLYLNPRTTGVGSSPPTASPPNRSPVPASPSAAPTAGASASAAAVRFTSPRYGYTVQHPSTYFADPADQDWPVDAPAGPQSAFLDRFTYAGQFNGATLFVGIASQALPAGTDAAAWIAGRGSPSASYIVRGCTSATGWQPATVAGVAALRFDADCDGSPGSEIVFVSNGRGWILTGDRGVVTSFADTMALP